MPRSTIVFKSLVRQVRRKKPHPYRNKSGVIQSSVGMIFKVQGEYKTAEEVLNGDNNYKVQLFFTQRAGYQGDRNAYNVVFPGGQCDGNQTDLEACKREIFEEISLDVDRQCAYMGQLPRNFYYLKKRGKELFVTCHLWLLKPEEHTWIAKLSQQELSDSRWVPLTQLLAPENYVITNSLGLGIIERMSLKFPLAQTISRKVRSVVLPELNLGMRRNLWGLTLWIWSFTLQMALRNLEQTQILPLQEFSQIKGYVKHSKIMQVNFERGFLLSYPISGVINIWHNLYRVRPFTYERARDSHIKLGLLVTLVALILISVASFSL